MQPQAHIVHQLKHRVRLRVPDQRGDPFWFEEVCEKLATLDSLSQYNTNTTTGCIVLHFPDSDWETVQDQVLALEVLELVDAPIADIPAMQPLLMGIKELDKTVASGSAGRVDLRTLAFLVLMVMAVRQIMRGQVLGPALPMLVSAWTLAEKFGSQPGNGEQDDPTRAEMDTQE